ncbi:sulfite exporter TauE/SafE family protein [Pseudonocardia sp. WMMC193]|uniref:sulfite exporter TauE/SafE family protein n=1 Tax=Pseudonocardia sp. WMMC193 TaxID=2911965 RepID=UPI001F2FE0A4|nr:sulfite exporter TauE/SafE family protein [Pseudonocardia sp. WMMC193]MCF7552417.1 sulfite exporter TauE/SafE family protein [Pseudonocardia sp. WMMC193]
MTGWQLAFLFVAGIGGGLTGSIAGLASLVSYPALLAVGLPPVVANVTNTVAMIGTTAGSVAGSRPELRGQGPVLLRLCALTAVGGAAGGALLLVTPSDAFEAIVPWLIALASVLLVVAPRLRAWATRHAAETAPATRLGPLTLVAAFGVALYGGYFGAAAGVMMLALLSVSWSQSLARSNAAKNVASGAANIVAAVVFAIVAPVHWAAVGALAAGLLIGSRIGPALVRRVPATPLRLAIGLAGLGLAASLWFGR